MKIKLDETALLVVDIQERLLPAMSEKEELLSNCIRLFKGAHTLGIPTVITQQYPNGLGATLSEVLNELPQAKIYDKTSFSCLNEEVLPELKAMGRKNIIVCGIEAHVCVLQTVIDLVYNEFQPILVVDCISSRKNSDKIYGIDRAK